MAVTRPPEPPKPPVDEKEVVDWARRFTDWAFRSFRSAAGLAGDQSQASILLVSPGKLVYTVHVEDDGTLTTTLVKS